VINLHFLQIARSGGEEGIGDTQARINPDYPRLRIGGFAQLRLANPDCLKALVQIWTAWRPREAG
jgi:hypothetical protein